MDGYWIKCKKCGKKLIKRRPDSLYEFRFGKRDEGESDSPVHMFIHGNIKMKCLRRGCEHETILNQFPIVEATQENINAAIKRR